MGFKKHAVKIYRIANVNRTFLKKELKSPLSSGISKRINLGAKGFLSESKVIYNLSTNDFRHYLTDHQRLRTRYINAPYSFVLDDKIVFESMYKEFIRIPKSLGLIKNGKIMPLSPQIKMEKPEDVYEYLEVNKACVIKPTRNGGGYGIHVIKKLGESFFINSKKVTFPELIEKIKGLNNYFISEFIEQGEFGNSLYPHTTNTVRIVTMIDPDTSKPFIPIAVQRIGNKTSAPTDNWTRGGLSAEVNLISGEIGAGASYPNNGKLEFHANHPETDSQIKGQVIPNWIEIKESILHAAARFPYIPYIGWDIIVTEEGYMVLEGNNFTDVNLLQVHKGLLKDERAKRFYKYHNILK